MIGGRTGRDLVDVARIFLVAQITGHLVEVEQQLTFRRLASDDPGLRAQPGNHLAFIVQRENLDIPNRVPFFVRDTDDVARKIFDVRILLKQSHRVVRAEMQEQCAKLKPTLRCKRRRHVKADPTQ